MSGQLTIKYRDLLALMEELENGMKQYYEGLADRFTEPNLQKLWVMMAEQEETHTRLVRLMRKRSEGDWQLENSVMEVSAREVQTIEDFLKEYETIITRPNLTLKEGFRTALTLESLELTPIYKPFIAKQDRPTRDVLAELLDAEDMHLQILVKAVKKHIQDPEFLRYADQVLEDHEESPQIG